MLSKLLTCTLASLSLAFGVFSAPAMAQNVVADAEQIASVMQKSGYRAEVVGEDGEKRYIRSGAGGKTFAVFMFGCDDDGNNCKTIQLYAGFKTDDPPSLELMNTYAAKKRWGRIYLDDDRDPVIEMDIDLEDGGLSEELFIDNLEYWEVVMANFSKFASSKEIP